MSYKSRETVKCPIQDSDCAVAQNQCRVSILILGKTRRYWPT